MYAKLKFNAGTTTSEAVRDIARLINDSNTGAADLNSLEFIDSASSELFAGVNSGWSLHTSTPLQSGAVTLTDSKYILQGTTLAGVSKYAGIHVNGAYSTFYNTTSAGVNLCAVLDPGTATEMFSAGYTSTTASTAGYNSVKPDSEIYIWAEPRKIIITGKDASAKVPVMAHLEFAETALTTWKSLPATAVWQWAPYGQTQNGSYDAKYRGTTFWSQTFSHNMVQFPGSVYSSRYGGLLRSLGFQASGSTYNSNYAFNFPTTYATLSNDTTNGLSFTIDNPSPVDQSGLVDQFPYILGEKYWNSSTNSAYDANGNSAVPLMPIEWYAYTISPEKYIFSGVSNVYHTIGGIGQVGDTITLGNGDVWQYLPYGTAYGALMIKRI